MAQKLVEIIASQKVFRDLDDGILSSIAANSNIIKKDAHKTVFFHNDTAHSFYCLLKGQVKLYRETMQGDEVILDIMSAPGLLGEMAVFNERIHDYSAETMEPSELVAIPIKHLELLLEQDHSFSLNLLNHFVLKNKGHSKDIEIRSILEAPQRIGCFLLDLSAPHKTGEQQIKLPYEKSVIARQLGMRPETFSRALKKLQQDVNVQIEGSTVHIRDLNALIDYTCSTCSDTFPCLKSCRLDSNQ
jgi:CRP-like cAMP-binding protein